MFIHHIEMKIERPHTYLLFLILALTVFLPKAIKCQDSISSSLQKKNTIKGIVILLPLISTNEFSIAIGYERRIDSTSSVELTSSFLFVIDEMGNKTRIFSVFPGYNHYFKKKRKKGPVFRLGSYISFVDKIPNDWGTGIYNFGLGVLGGTRFKISKSRKWHLDIALGLSLNYQIKYDVYRMRDESPWQVLPRPVIHFARTF